MVRVSWIQFGWVHYPHKHPYNSHHEVLDTPRKKVMVSVFLPWLRHSTFLSVNKISYWSNLCTWSLALPFSSLDFFGIFASVNLWLSRVLLFFNRFLYRVWVHLDLLPKSGPLKYFWCSVSAVKSVNNINQFNIQVHLSFCPFRASFEPLLEPIPHLWGHHQLELQCT